MYKIPLIFIELHQLPGSCAKNLQIYRLSFLSPTQVGFNNTSYGHVWWLKSLKITFFKGTEHCLIHHKWVVENHFIWISPCNQLFNPAMTKILKNKLNYKCVNFHADLENIFSKLFVYQSTKCWIIIFH